MNPIYTIYVLHEIVNPGQFENMGQNGTSEFIAWNDY